MPKNNSNKEISPNSHNREDNRSQANKSPNNEPEPMQVNEAQLGDLESEQSDLEIDQKYREKYDAYIFKISKQAFVDRDEMYIA